MAHLTLAGISEDKARLLLVDDSGAEFTLDVDHALRAALRGEAAALGQLEIHMESALRPREIQSRIRAGESPEEVAQAAQTTVDKIMPFAGPVLAERAHIADRAQRATLRHKSGEAGGRTLGDAVAAQLRPLNAAEDAVEWDASRREDGRWELTGSFKLGKRKGPAVFTFDLRGNFVLTENDAAHWLVGKIPDNSEPASHPRTRARRLSAVESDELPLGEDALELVAGEAAVADLDDTTDLTGTVAQIREPEPEAVVEAEPEPEPDAVEAPEPDTEPAAEEPAPKKAPRRRGRASVPSWDEIMFGGKTD